MRQILFRGKRLDNEAWTEGYLVEQNSPDYHAYIIEEFVAELDNRHMDIMACEMKEIDPATIGQFTGLTAQNGKKIFEGDMVVSYDLSGNTDGCGIVNWNDLFVAWHMGKHSLYGRIASYDVIGTIHDKTGSFGGST